MGQGIRRAISEGLVSRADIFVTTKIWLYNLKRDDLIAQARESNENLGLGYIDLLLIHGPLPFKKIDSNQFYSPGPDGQPLLAADVDIHRESWSAMEHVAGLGIARSIGVSNYSIKLLQKTLAHASIKPSVNQVECNPFFQQSTCWLQRTRSEGVKLELLLANVDGYPK